RELPCELLQARSAMAGPGPLAGESRRFLPAEEGQHGRLAGPLLLGLAADPISQRVCGTRTQSGPGEQLRAIRGRRPLQGRLRAETQRRSRREHRAWRERRSEEHTSELQSPCNLVCRLLLEKKKERTLHRVTA